MPNAVAGRGGAYSVLVLGPAVPELAQVVPAIGKGVLGALSAVGGAGESMINFLGDVSGPEEVLAAYPAGSRERLRGGQARRRPGRRLLLRPRHLRACDDQVT